MNYNTIKQPAPAPPRKKTLIRGIQIFIFFSLIGIIGGFWWKKPADIDSLLNHFNLFIFMGILLLVALNYFLGGLRFRIFFNGKPLPLISLWNCIRADWANTFVGTVTPFQTGGGPAQLYILWRCGAKVSDVALVALLNFSSTLIFFLVASTFAIVIIPADLMGPNFTVFIRSSFVFITLLFGLILTVLFYSNVGLYLVKKILFLIPIKIPKFVHLREQLLNTLQNEISHFEHSFRNILKTQKWLLLFNFVVTAALYFSKYLIGFLIAISLEKIIPFTVFIGLQIIQLVFLYFTPTPGGSGLAELSSTWLIGFLVSEGNILYFTIFWRFFTTILGAAIGGIVLFLDMKSWLNNTVPSFSAEENES